MNRVTVLFLQIGSPANPSVKAVRSYLAKFLDDHRVLDIPLFWRKILLYLFILPLRPYQSARAYKRIWQGDSFPLVSFTHNFAQGVQDHLPPSFQVASAFLLSSPSVGDVWPKCRGAENWIIIPLFPQYSESTTGSTFDKISTTLARKKVIPSLRFISHFHRSKAFIDNSVKQIEEFIGTADILLLSFHGLPKRRVLGDRDPYYLHCWETFCLIRNRTTTLPREKILISFQSRLGSEEWLEPATDELAKKLVDKVPAHIAIYCPSFVADCLETVDEIGFELKREIEKKGGTLTLIPALNDRPSWCLAFAKEIEGMLDCSNPTYTVSPEDKNERPVQKMKNATPLGPQAKSTLKIIFWTLFLDLIGFSIIFPLFPALAQYYLEIDPDNFFLQFIFKGDTPFSPLILFGGVLGALYSLLQFIAAPLWGSISDRVGRRPVLLLSMAMLAISYGMWIFAGSFTLLIVARFLGGIMGGNISTATAVVADITSKENRSKGMAIIGVAFALGFIFGPAIGGLLSLIDLTKITPQLVEWGINPFSVPAAFAGLLCLINFSALWFKFKETLPQDDSGPRQARLINPFKLFRPLPHKGVNLTNFGHFLFLTIFSGMEFTLAFMALERMGFTPMDNAYMFIFVGVVLVLVQGGFVRRKAHQVGEKKMALMGLILVSPGMILLALAHSLPVLYAGLLFLAIGSAMAIPTLTSLVSIYTPPQKQGLSIGIFRSLGALARFVGPTLATLSYWKWGSASLYWGGAFALVLPVWIVSLLPPPAKETE